jgi:hypothetical protein
MAGDRHQDRFLANAYMRLEDSVLILSGLRTRIRVTPIRVHFGPMPQMLRTIISDLLCNERDIEIVGNSYERDSCLKEVRRSNAAVIIAQDSEDEAVGCLDLIGRLP